MTSELGSAQLGTIALGDSGDDTPTPPSPPPDPSTWAVQCVDPYVPKREVIGY